MYVRILAIDDEPVSNYEPEDLKLPMLLADCCADTEPEVRRHAIEILWDSRWTPGSISWRVYRDDGTETNVGENYG